MKKNNFEITVERSDNMNYEEIIHSIKCGFDLGFKTSDGILIDIFAGLTKECERKQSYICYSLAKDNDTITICDKQFYRDEIENMEFYKDRTLKDLLENNEIVLSEIY